MKIKLTKCILALIAFTFVLTGCSNNDEAISTIQPANQEILTFSSDQDYQNALEKVSAMSKTERLAWEKSKGFKSFGTICDEFYSTIKSQDFKTIEEINAFVEKNSDKIQIYRNEAGEKYCEVQEFDNSARYLMNKDRMYIVGNMVLRKFDEGLVSTDIASISALRKVKSYSDLAKNLIPETYKTIKQKSTTINTVQSDEVINEHVYREKGLFGYYNVTYRIVVRLKAEKYFDSGSIMTFNHYLIQVSNYYWNVILWGVDPGINTSYNVTMSSSDNDVPPHDFSVNRFETNVGIREHTPFEDYHPICGGDVNNGVHLVSYNVYATNVKGCLINSGIHTY